MATFELEIVTMDGPIYKGEVERVILRTVQGDVAILARHADYCTAIGMGKASVLMPDGTERHAACIGGMLSVMDGRCRVIPTTWEWGDEIDVERAKAAHEEAMQRMEDKNLEAGARGRAEAKLRRALVRMSVAGK